MSLNIHFRAILAVVFLCGGAARSLGQANQHNSANVRRVAVSGVVLNSETNDPIPGALVEVQGFAMLADDRGQFSFAGVPVTTTVIRAEKPGFLPYGDTTRTLELQPIDIVDHMPPVTLKLVPEGIILGRVTAQDSSPVDGIPVWLLQTIVQKGLRIWQLRSRTQTDDRGEFRIADLRQGTYSIGVGPSQASGVLPGITGIRPKGFGLSFYPTSPDLTSSAPVIVAPGKKIQVDFSLTSQPLYRISGSVTGIQGLQQVAAQLWAADGMAPITVQVNSQTGRFQSNAVPAGEYTLKAIITTRAAGRTPQLITAQPKLTVNSDLADVHFSFPTPPSIPVNIRQESSSQQQGGESSVSLEFFPLDRAFTMNWFEVPRMVRKEPGESSLVVQGGESGRYSVEIHTNGSSYVASATFGSLDLLRDDFVLSDEPPTQPIEIELREGAGGIILQVSSPPVGIIGAAAFAISEEHPSVLLESQLTEAGVGYFGGLAPGNYRVFAVDNAVDFEFRKPEILRPYVSNASRVAVGEKQQASVTVSLIHRED